MLPEILIVDDDPVMLRLYSRIFSGRDYAITSTGSLAAASALINANHYDLLITDLMLGDGLGTELALLFAKRAPCAKTLVVSGSLVEADNMDLSAVSECLSKPLDIDRFIETISRVLKPPPEALGGAFPDKTTLPP